MDEAIGRFLAHLERNGRAENTRLAYRADLEQFMAVVQDLCRCAPVAESLEAEHLRGYLDWLEAQGYRPSTVSRKVAAVRTFLRFNGLSPAVLDGHVGPSLRRPVSPRPRVLSTRQVRRLVYLPLEGAPRPRDVRDAALMGVLYAIGLRAGDVIALSVEDVELDRQRLRLGRPERPAAPLGLAHEPLGRYLKDARPQLVRRDQDSTLFLNQRGERLTRQGVWLIVKRWARRAGLGDGVTPHTLRHSLAHHLLQSGTPRREVQRLLGLNSRNALRIYRDVTPERSRHEHG